jgi:Ca2+-binding RTX toxin-like protein
LRSRRTATTLFALVALGLVFATSLEALRPLCGGRRATIASNDRMIPGTKGPDVIIGGRGPNEILGGRGNDVICGGYGRDRIFGGRGKDTIDGKKNADLVDGGRGSDEVDGGAGPDEVRGDSGNDAVRGGPAGHDDVDGGLGDDVVDGGRGAFDTVSGGVGRDRIDGGPGSHDTASYLNAGGPIAVDLQRGRVTGAEKERLVQIEDVLTAAEANQAGSPGLVIAGGDGADTLAVSFSHRRYLVSGLGSGPVQLGGRKVTSILVSLGPGNDTVSFDRTLPDGVSITIDGGTGSDWLRGGPGRDTLYAGDDDDPDRLAGGGGDDALFGVNILHPRRASGPAALFGGGGNDLMIGGQPCDGDLFRGGGGKFDSASFARVRNGGTAVRAKVGGLVVDPDVPGCTGGRIAGSTEKIEGSAGRDVLIGSARGEVLLGRGGSDVLDGKGGADRCIGGSGRDEARRCEYVR